MSTDELERLRALLEADWPGFAAQREDVELEDAAPAIASLWKVVGWAPVLDAWPDPRTVDHEAQLGEWIAEGRIEYELFDEDADPDEEPEPETMATAFPVTREQLPTRARVLRRSDEGGDFALWITDEDRGEADPPVIELNLRPSWAGPPPLGVDDFTRTVPQRAVGFIAAALIHDLGDRRAVTAALAITDPEGDVPLPRLAPDLLALAPGVWLERGYLAGIEKDRLGADSFAAILAWARSGGARTVTSCSAPLGGASIAVRDDRSALDSLLEDPVDLAEHRLGSIAGVAVWVAPLKSGAVRVHVAGDELAIVEAQLSA